MRRRRLRRQRRRHRCRRRVSRYGSPDANPYAPTRLAVPRVASGVARRGASPYYVAPDPPPDAPLQRRLPPPDETPFDPIGIQVGAFNFKPAIELTGGYDTNPARTGGTPTPSWYSIVAPELKFNSNWARHEFKGDLRGSYYTYEQLSTQNRPNVDNKLTGRVDVTRDTRIDLEAKYLIGTDSPGSPNIQAGLAKLPIFQTWGGTVGVGHRFNRFDISAKGGAERTVYQNSRLHRRLDREQRRPQLQPLQHATARQLRGHARRQAVRRGRRRPPRARSRDRLLRLPAQFGRRLWQGWLHLRVHPHPHRRHRRRLAASGASRIRPCRTSPG